MERVHEKWLDVAKNAFSQYLDLHIVRAQQTVLWEDFDLVIQSNDGEVVVLVGSVEYGVCSIAPAMNTLAVVLDISSEIIDPLYVLDISSYDKWEEEFGQFDFTAGIRPEGKAQGLVADIDQIIAETLEAINSDDGWPDDVLLKGRQVVLNIRQSLSSILEEKANIPQVLMRSDIDIMPCYYSVVIPYETSNRVLVSVGESETTDITLLKIEIYKGICGSEKVVVWDAGEYRKPFEEVSYA